ncbi:MAG: hypothetical protein VXW65_13060, partial [Pseudomonadota bacterium]|nr:hypothetical protein [Pseudomonadota bacterium]
MSLNKVDLVSTSAPDLLKEIQKLNKLKHYQDALSLSETATKQYPKSAALYKQNALINLKLKRVKEAHTSFMRFFKLNQDKDLIAADIYEKFFENSLKLVKKPSGKVFKEASEILSLLESIDVNGFEVALYKAAFLVVGRDYDLAVSSYDDCLQKGVAFRKTDGELYIKALFNSFRYKELDSFIRSDYALPLGELRLAKEKKRVALLLNLADAQTLASTEYYRISIFRQQSPKGVFITFGTAADDLDSEPFGMDFLLSYGYDLIFVAQENTNRYQDLSFETFEEIVAPVVKCGRYEKVYTYGVSLGGYSALYYSGCINAIAFAASPLNPWDVS